APPGKCCCVGIAVERRFEHGRAQEGDSEPPVTPGKVSRPIVAVAVRGAPSPRECSGRSLRHGILSDSKLGWAMRVESSVTTVSWIPSEAVTGPLLKGSFDSGFTSYDDPLPDS